MKLPLKSVITLVAVAIGWTLMVVAYDRPEWYLQLIGIAGALLTFGAVFWWCQAVYARLKVGSG